MRRPIRAFLAAAALFAAIPPAGRGQPAPSETDCRRITQKLEWASARLSDWPQLGYYRNANLRLGAPRPGEERVVFLGDEITSYWKLEEDFPGRPYLNRGIGGQTTPQMLLRFRPDAVDLRARAVVLLAGGNDLAGMTGPVPLETVEGNIASIAELARAHRVRLVLASLLPAAGPAARAGGGENPAARRSPGKIRELNAWIRSYCAQSGLIYLDYFSAMADGNGELKADLSDNGLVPNRKGYRVMAPLAGRAIAAALRGGR